MNEEYARAPAGRILRPPASFFSVLPTFEGERAVDSISHYFAPYPAGLSTVKTYFDTLLLNVSPDSIVATTPEGRVMYWLKGSETMFGHTSVEAALAPLECLIAPAKKSHEVFGRDRRGSGQ